MTATLVHASASPAGMPSANPQRPATSRDADPLASVREQARAFEGLLLGKLLEPMWSGIATDGAFGGGHAEEAWRGLLIQEYANTMAGRGGIGLADSLVRHLITTQEV